MTLLYMIWVQWYHRVCLHPVTAHVRVNMVTAWLPVVSLSNDHCQNVSICHCVCLPTVIRFLFLIYKDTSSSSSSLWTSLSTAHKNSYCQSFISFLYSRAVVKTSLSTVKCHFVTYIASVTASCIPTYNLTVYCMLSSILRCSFYTSMNKSILSTAYFFVKTSQFTAKFYC